MKKKMNIGYIYFILPLFFFLFIYFSREADIWFLLSHGRYVLNNGFPHTEFLTIHNNFHFVMQQWGFSVITYLLYHVMGSVGVIIFIGILNLLILYFLYKLCMRVSNNTYFSCLIASLIDLLLELNFIIPRPQMISILIILVVIYILERKDKSILFLPLLSLLLINMHASMWPVLFVVCMPFLVEYVCLREKYVILLLIVFFISFLIGFINPYGIEAMTYSFSSYGIDTINSLIGEMHSFSLMGEDFVVYNSILFLVLFVALLISMFLKRKKYSLHSMFLVLGLAFMAFLNLRNMSLFLIGAFPFITLVFKKKIKQEIPVYIYCFFGILLISVFIFRASNNVYKLEDNNMNNVVHFLNSNYENKENIVLFNYFNDGPYLEYCGYKTYIDTRAEVFIKNNNHKYDVLEEYFNVLSGNIDYSKFVEKYKFTHLIVAKDSYIYDFLIKNSDYQIVYKEDEIIVFGK